MFKRNATALWRGTGKEGTGELTTESTVLRQTPYSFAKRFGDEPGTNPEELIAAAHAGCFTMQFSFNLNAAGYTADELSTSAVVTFDTKQKAITQIHLVVTGNVPGIAEEEFIKIAEDAKANCPVSKLLQAAEITMEAGLVTKD